MSDGPHRSLPLRRHWQDYAERAAKPAYSDPEVCEALSYALKRDVLEAPISEVRAILSSDTLFPELRAKQLEGLRQSHRGSASANRLIDNAVEAARSGVIGEIAAHQALRNSIEDTERDCSRGIEEHYHREASSRTAGFIRPRLSEARQGIDLDSIARELLASSQPPSSRSVTLPRRGGVDDGPTL